MPTETLTSRERVVRTLRREPVDRMPIDLGCHFSTGISAFAYWHLREYLGLSTDAIWVPDVVQFLAYVDDDILQRFHCDCMLLYPRWQHPMRWSPRPPYEFTLPASLDPEVTASGDIIVRQGERSMRLPQGGYFVDFEDYSEEDGYTVTEGQADTHTYTPGFNAKAGFVYRFQRSMGIAFEAKYTYLKGNLSSLFEGFEKFDLSGLTITAGLNFFLN